MNFPSDTIRRIGTNLALAVAFGALSLLFGQVQFKIPGVGGITGLNEIPSLIGVFYLSNPLYLVVVSAVSSLGTPSEGSSLSTFFFHICGLIPFWFYYKRLLANRDLSTFHAAVRAGSGVILYYLLLIIPVLVLISMVINTPQNDFGTFYIQVVQSASWEITTTTIIVTLYLLHLNAQERLKEYLRKLEDRVCERTAELDETIKKLHAANAELESINETLDEAVTRRTQELENRNIQLTGYAFINSHLLRAPLARLLGLSSIIRNEVQSLDDAELMDKFLATCLELDQVIKLIGEFLSEESILSTHQLRELQDKIRQLADEIKAIA